MMTLAFKADKDGIAWPKRSTLAGLVNVSERHLKRLLRSLELAGELYVNVGRGRGNNSEYFIMVGLEEEEIIEVLTQRFDLSEEEAQKVLSPSEKQAEKGTCTSPKEKGTSSASFPFPPMIIYLTPLPLSQR